MSAYILMRFWWPNDKADEIGKTFLKIAGTLKICKRVSESPFFITDEYGGSKSYNLFEVEEGKLFEALKELNKYVVNYRHIPGFRFKIEPVMSAKDALPMIGLQTPTQK